MSCPSLLFPLSKMLTLIESCTFCRSKKHTLENCLEFERKRFYHLIYRDRYIPEMFKRSLVCFNCFEPGHKKKTCPTVKEEEEEPRLSKFWKSFKSSTKQVRSEDRNSKGAFRKSDTFQFLQW